MKRKLLSVLTTGAFNRTKDAIVPKHDQFILKVNSLINELNNQIAREEKEAAQRESQNNITTETSNATASRGSGKPGLPRLSDRARENTK